MRFRRSSTTAIKVFGTTSVSDEIVDTLDLPKFDGAPKRVLVQLVSGLTKERKTLDMTAAGRNGACVCPEWNIGAIDEPSEEADVAMPRRGRYGCAMVSFV
jgi:hypothetical protein